MPVETDLVDHRAGLADVKGGSRLNANGAGNISGGEVRGMIKGSGEETVEIGGIPFAFLWGRQWGHELVHDEYSPVGRTALGLREHGGGRCE